MLDIGRPLLVALYVAMEQVGRHAVIWTTRWCYPIAAERPPPFLQPHFTNQFQPSILGRGYYQKHLQNSSPGGKHFYLYVLHTTILLRPELIMIV